MCKHNGWREREEKKTSGYTAWSVKREKRNRSEIERIRLYNECGFNYWVNSIFHHANYDGMENKAHFLIVHMKKLFRNDLQCIEHSSCWLHGQWNCVCAYFVRSLFDASVCMTERSMAIGSDSEKRVPFKIYRIWLNRSRSNIEIKTELFLCSYFTGHSTTSNWRWSSAAMDKFRITWQITVNSHWIGREHG